MELERQLKTCVINGLMETGVECVCLKTSVINGLMETSVDCVC